MYETAEIVSVSAISGSFGGFLTPQAICARRGKRNEPQMDADGRR
jgi:hypothetical protein